MSIKFKILIPLIFLSQFAIAETYQFATKLDPVIESTFALPPPSYPAFEGSDSGHEAGDVLPLISVGGIHYTGSSTYIISNQRDVVHYEGLAGSGSSTIAGGCDGNPYSYVVYYDASIDSVLGADTDGNIIRNCHGGSTDYEILESFGHGRNVQGITSSDGQNFIVLVDGRYTSRADTIIVYDNSTDRNILMQKELPPSVYSYSHYTGLTYASGSLYTTSYYGSADNTVHEIDPSTLNIINSYDLDTLESRPEQIGYDGNNLIITYNSPLRLYIQGMYWK